MPLILCNNKKCAHEFEWYNDTKPVCDWCDSDDTTVLEEKTGLERVLERTNDFFCCDLYEE